MIREALDSRRRLAGVESPVSAHLLLIGTNHRTSSLDARERLLRKASYSSLRKAGGSRPPWSDLILLTTCNRIEVYTLTGNSHPAAETVRTAFRLSTDDRTLDVL